MGFLTGKTAIITGAGYAVLSDGRCGSIGYGIATAYAKEGANLVITGRNVAKLEKALANGVRIAAAPASDLPEPPPFDMPGDMDAPPFDMDTPAPAEKHAAKKAPAEKAAPKKAEAEGQDKWDAAVKALTDANKALLPLSKAVYTGIEDGVAILEFAKNDNMYLKMLDKDERKRAIGEKFSELLGQSVTIAMRLQGAAKAKSADPERTETIQHARDVFGRENVDFLD